MVFVFIIIGSVLGFIFSDFTGAMIGSILGVLVFISYQLEKLESLIKKQINKPDAGPRN